MCDICDTEFSGVLSFFLPPPLFFPSLPPPPLSLLLPFSRPSPQFFANSRKTRVGPSPGPVFRPRERKSAEKRRTARQAAEQKPRARRPAQFLPPASRDDQGRDTTRVSDQCHGRGPSRGRQGNAKARPARRTTHTTAKTPWGCSLGPGQRSPEPPSRGLDGHAGTLGR